MKLDARLRAAAEAAGRCALFADIGSDHAKLALAFCWKPARPHTPSAPISTRPRLNAGGRPPRARGFRSGRTSSSPTGWTRCPNGLDVAAVCGMGGELIADIVARALRRFPGGLADPFRPPADDGRRCAAPFPVGQRLLHCGGTLCRRCRKALCRSDRTLRALYRTGDAAAFPPRKTHIRSLHRENAKRSPQFRLSGTRIRPSEFVRLRLQRRTRALLPSSAPAELVSAPAELVYIECNGRTRSVLPEFRPSGTRIRPGGTRIHPSEFVCPDVNGERAASPPSSAPAELVYICRPASRQAPPADARIPRLRPARLRCGGKTAARPSRGRRRPCRRSLLLLREAGEFL